MWEILVAIPAGQRTDRVCQMVLESHDREEFLEAIRRMIRAGELEAGKYGNRYLILRSEIEWWTLQQKLGTER